jgi:hypothetical protein
MPADNLLRGLVEVLTVTGVAVSLWRWVQSNVLEPLEACEDAKATRQDRLHSRPHWPSPLAGGLSHRVGGKGRGLGRSRYCRERPAAYRQGPPAVSESGGTFPAQAPGPCFATSASTVSRSSSAQPKKAWEL